MTSAVSESARKRMRMRFRKKIVICSHMTCHFVLPFCVWGWEDKVTMHVLRRQKRPENKKIRSPSDARKDYLKTWDRWNSQSFQKHFLWTLEGGLTAPHMNPQLQGPTCWHTLGYGYRHKTQSFMKNGGQRKCLDKALGD